VSSSSTSPAMDFGISFAGLLCARIALALSPLRTYLQDNQLLASPLTSYSRCNVLLLAVRTNCLIRWRSQCRRASTSPRRGSIPTLVVRFIMYVPCCRLNTSGTHHGPVVTAVPVTILDRDSDGVVDITDPVDVCRWSSCSCSGENMESKAGRCAQ
jgi:hypothetical protein